MNDRNPLTRPSASAALRRDESDTLSPADSPRCRAAAAGGERAGVRASVTQ